MKGEYIKPSELLRLLKETGKSYWDLIGRPLYEDGKDKEEISDSERQDLMNAIDYAMSLKLDRYDDGKGTVEYDRPEVPIEVDYNVPRSELRVDPSTGESFTTSGNRGAIMLPEVEIVANKPTAAQRLGAYMKKAPAADIDKVMLGTLALGSLPIVAQALPSLAPGSAFWMNPVTQETFKSTAGALGVDALTKATTGITPEEFAESHGVPPLFSPMFNPGAYGLYGAVGNIKNLLQNQIRNFADRYFFIEHPGSYTRGIGWGTEGLEDAINTGVIRGNPRGTEVTAKGFGKLKRKNRDHFRDIMNDTGIKGIDSKWLSRTLTESEFNAIKKASKPYSTKRMFKTEDGFEIRETSADPLLDYKDYNEYVASVTRDKAFSEAMPSRVVSGEVQTNDELILGADGILHGRPIEERFGANSDFVSDGYPLSYWYPDGRNPLTKGYDYAGSRYGIRVNNPEEYIPFMHLLHMHPSFFKTPRLEDPNIEVFKRGPFGITIKMNKNKLLKRHNSGKSPFINQAAGLSYQGYYDIPTGDVGIDLRMPRFGGGKTPNVATAPKFDDAEAARYIGWIENADSVGFDKKRRIWTPPKSAAYDRNSIGMGLDMRKENNPYVYNYLRDNGRLKNPYLTEKEERMLREKTWKQKKDTYMTPFIQKYGPYLNQTGYNRAAGMLWQGHPYKMMNNEDSVTGKAFQRSIKRGDKSLQHTFDTYYGYKDNATRYENRRSRDKSFK